MPVREKNGLVHAVEHYYMSGPNGMYGITLCGMIYQHKRKDTTWKTMPRDRVPPVYRMRPSSRMPTCVACAAGVRIHTP
jgi:hypothetical protein